MNRMRERMKRLEQEAIPMRTANHGRFIADAMQALRDPAAFKDTETDEIEAPLRALRLLDALWGSSYADRSEPKLALNDVGLWLEKRLLRTVEITTEELLVELGWLKRLAKHQETLGMRTPSSRLLTKAFGKRIAELERRRQAAFELAKAPTPSQELPLHEAKKKAPAVPVALPEEMQVTFADFNKARDIRKATAERAKKQKAPKEARLALTAVAELFSETQIVCSTTQTEGMNEVFERVKSTTGAMDWVLYASGLERKEDGTVFAKRVSLKPVDSR